MRHTSPLVTILPAVPAGISERPRHALPRRRRLLALSMMAVVGGALIFGFVWLVL